MARNESSEENNEEECFREEAFVAPPQRAKCLEHAAGRLRGRAGHRTETSCLFSRTYETHIAFNTINTLAAF